MKIGIILIFNNSKHQITDKLKTLFDETYISKICLVNNASRDNTLEVLKDLKDNFKNISIVDVKKNKGLYAAVKAGVRYLESNDDFHCILYLKLTDFDNIEKLSLIKGKCELLKKKTKKRTGKIFNNTYSMNDFFEKKLI